MGVPEIRFRVDASSRIGSGHVMRCLTLAEELQRVGARVAFICRDLPGNHASWLQQRGHTVTLLPAAVTPLSAGDHDGYLGWLGVTLDEEIAQSRAALASDAHVDWVVVDHYALDQRWESAVCPAGASVLAIDDIANRGHACRLLLDQNYYPEAAGRYDGLADGAQLLLGPAFSLLRPAFPALRNTVHRHGCVRKLLVFMGGADADNVTAVVVRALASMGGNRPDTDVIVGQSNPHIEALALLCTAAGIGLLTQVENMAEHMAKADLFIGATGVTTWERAALGLPTLAVSVAENQRDIARFAHEAGLLRWLGDAADINEVQWIGALKWALANPDSLAAQSTSGMNLVDGLGATRVVEKMLGHYRHLH